MEVHLLPESLFCGCWTFFCVKERLQCVNGQIFCFQKGRPTLQMSKPTDGMSLIVSKQKAPALGRNMTSKFAEMVLEEEMGLCEMSE